MAQARQPREPSAQALIMRGSGFVTAAEAATAIGAANVGTIHRMLKAEKLEGQRLGFYWYVLGQSLFDVYEGTPIEQRVRDLVDELGIKIKKNGGRRVAGSR